jgi:hypothetical protein
MCIIIIITIIMFYVMSTCVLQFTNTFTQVYCEVFELIQWENIISKLRKEGFTILT